MKDVGGLGKDEAGLQTHIPEDTQAIFDQPVGGKNTISVSVANCFNCPMVNVLVDPDGYWQRSESDNVITGQADPRFYNALVQSVASFGLYTWPERVVILPAFKENCPQYYKEGQVFFMSLALSGQRRQTVFDAGCAGSDFANQAVGAINSLSQINQFQDILAGQMQATDVASPEARAVPPQASKPKAVVSENGYPLPPSLKPWGG